MPDKTYLFHYVVAFDPLSTSVSQEALDNYIMGHRHVSAWWRYLPGLYIIETPLYVAEAREWILPIMGGANFLIMMVDPRVSDGWLPMKAWEWLRKRPRTQEELRVRFQAARNS